MTAIRYAGGWRRNPRAPTAGFRGFEPNQKRRRRACCGDRHSLPSAGKGRRADEPPGRSPLSGRPEAGGLLRPTTLWRELRRCVKGTRLRSERRNQSGGGDKPGPARMQTLPAGRIDKEA